MSRAPRSRTLKAPEFRPRLAPRGRTPAGVPAPETHADRDRPGWRVVVADYGEARLYVATADVSGLKLLATMRNPAAWKMERQLVSGRGGSKFNRMGGAYQTLTPRSQAHRDSSEQFAKAVATLAGRGLAAGERLALLAAPRLLGLIVRALPAGSRARLARTVARDVTHERAAELRARLTRALVP
jgi:protein required for attachment to host cells